MTTRQMALTPDLLAQVHRVLADPGPDSNVVSHSEEDYNAIVKQHLVTQIRGQDLWLSAHGWHRAFRLRITRWRATEDQPGLMMGLDRDGQCRGALYRIPAAREGNRLTSVEFYHGDRLGSQPPNWRRQYH
jgi:glutathione-specific gamma-glutamylcyclotransferase